MSVSMPILFHLQLYLSFRLDLYLHIYLKPLQDKHFYFKVYRTHRMAACRVAQKFRGEKHTTKETNEKLYSPELSSSKAIFKLLFMTKLCLHASGPG